MRYIFSGSARQYASTAATIREQNGKVRTRSIYLGKVIDLKNGIFHSKERGLFSFDIHTGTFCDLPDDFPVSAADHKETPEPRILDFGDVFFLDAFFWQTGLHALINTLPWKEKDTLFSLVCFYIAGPALCRCTTWYSGSIARKLYPHADLSAQGIHACQSCIGQRDVRINFLEAWSSFVLQTYGLDANVLVDSPGFLDRVNLLYPAVSACASTAGYPNHLVFVVQRSTGLPVFYDAVSSDAAVLETVLAHLDAMHIDVDSCLLETQLNTAYDLDLFYENHRCKLGCIAPVFLHDKSVQAILQQDIGSITDPANLVDFLDHSFLIAKRAIPAGKNQDNPGWLYLGLDPDAAANLQKEQKNGAGKMDAPAEAACQPLCPEGLFGLVSGKEYEARDILPAWFQLDSIQQTFDPMKSHIGILYSQNLTPQVYQGHLLLSFIAAGAMKMIQCRLQGGEGALERCLGTLRNEKCFVYSNRIVPDASAPEAQALYEAFQIPCFKTLRVVNGAVSYRHPKPQVPSASIILKRKPGRPPGSRNKKNAGKRSPAGGTVIHFARYRRDKAGTRPAARFPKQKNTGKRNPEGGTVIHFARYRRDKAGTRSAAWFPKQENTGAERPITADR